ncbi:MAG: Rpn family recombination-promoting nuclease/putative transposase, partial [Defluviitaleaceae bacterium]|nr:Rpn family recombination-promoting nuclease/putative transposase [Defluviitaleaceae bacterium]
MLSFVNSCVCRVGGDAWLTIHKARDNSVKAILAEPELFVEFLHNFIPVEILKDVAPTDIEDVSERLLSLVSEQKDGDTIKRINLKGDKPLFVITIVEHESSVNFRASFKMLLYIALILNDYEKEVNKESSQNTNKSTKVTLTKDFKYPPVLPIILYAGDDEWTAETNFLNRTEMSDIFEKYIPKFEYELVNLNKYSFADLAEFEG